MAGRIFELTKHRELWDWLSKNPDMDKRDWPGWKKYAIRDAWTLNYCFACKAARDQLASWPASSAYEMEKNCREDCPLQLGCQRKKSLYDRWYYAQTRSKRKRLAEKIRDIEPGADWTCI